MNKGIASILWCFFALISYAQNNEIMVKGLVTTAKVALINAEVRSEQTGEVIKTNSQGRYAISSSEGDVLTFSYPGQATVEIIVEDVTSVLNISMSPELNVLNEVVVEKTRKRTQHELKAEYNSNKNLINTAFGILDERIASGPMRVIDKSEFKPSGFDLASALIYRFPSVQVVRPPENPTKPVIFVRGRGSGPVIYDVDGVVLRDFPDFLVLDNIERLAVLSGLGVVARYGGIGKGGVIVINTKSGSNFWSPSSEGPIDKALLSNNEFDEVVLTEAQLSRNMPEYQKAFDAAATEKDAVRIYEENIRLYGSSYFFVLDAFDHFRMRWKNDKFADQLLKERWRLFESNPVALKALAYLYQKTNDYRKAHDIMKEVFILRPNYSQSYRDLALSYTDLGQYRKAIDMYARYKYLVSEGFMPSEDSVFRPYIDRELCNLLDLHGKTFKGYDELLTCKVSKNFEGTLLVFEWNDSEAEFQLQFVNPDKRYAVWDHSLLADPERIRDEKMKGYSCEEFLIDGNLEGLWQVNLKYFGNKSLTPTYLKATIYYNYGTKNQRQESKVFKVFLKDVSQQLFTIRNNPDFNNY